VGNHFNIKTDLGQGKYKR